MALINCPECGSQVSDQSATCIKCGYPLANDPKIEKPKCPECGNEIDENDTSCSKCGYPLRESTKNTKRTNNVNEDQKFFEQIAFNVAYGLSKKSIIKKLIGLGLEEGKAIDVVYKIKESNAGRSLLAKKYRTQFIIGIIMTVLSFIIIGAATADNPNPPFLLILIFLFGIMFSIRGVYGWIRYRVPKQDYKIPA